MVSGVIIKLTIMLETRGKNWGGVRWGGVEGGAICFKLSSKTLRFPECHMQLHRWTIREAGTLRIFFKLGLSRIFFFCLWERSSEAAMGRGGVGWEAHRPCINELKKIESRGRYILVVISYKLFLTDFVIICYMHVSSRCSWSSLCWFCRPILMTYIMYCKYRVAAIFPENF